MISDTEKNVRLFYALWPDQATRAALQRWQQGMPGRLIAPENLHLTLAFLGKQPAALLPELQALLTRLTPPAIPLLLDQIGCFGKHRIVWAGTQTVPAELLALQQELTRLLKQGHYSFDQGLSFQAHVTLARDANPATGKQGMENRPAHPIAWMADQLVLAQSIPGQPYEIVARC